MRKVATIMAVLMLAGCGESTDKPRAPQVAAQPAAMQWYLKVSDTTQAVSDLVARLLDRGLSSSVVVENGEQRIWVGPFTSEAQAQEKKALIMSKLSLDSIVIEHQAIP